jgi:rod shape determining protein RodA
VKRKAVFSFDLVLFSAVVALIVVGVLFIFSSGVNSSGILVSQEFIKQGIWALTGVAVLIFFAFFSYSTLRTFSLYIYAGTILLLMLTLLIGRTVNGSRSWIGIWELGIQPAEFAKIATILFLGTYLTGIGNGIRELPRFLLGLFIVLIPVALTLLQPDFGTALVYFPIFLIMAFIAGAQAKHILFIVVTGVLMVVFAAFPSIAQASATGAIGVFRLLSDIDILKILLMVLFGVAGISYLGYRRLKQSYFYWIFYFSALLFLSLAGSLALRLLLAEYQIMRLMIFVDPQLDPRGAGWNIIQSVTAIGSGGFWGKGFLHGTQSHYHFLPQQSTDFIFSILAEEWGFLGGLFVLALFLVILLRGMSIVYGSKEDYATLIGSGILAMLFFHVVVNVGMAMGIMPVTGIPLMLLSYGGSSLWTAMTGVGILMNISRRRLRYHE